MKTIIANLGYFIKETFTTLRTNLLSNLLSFISITLAFFLLALVITTWMISLQIIDVMEGEAEINVFFNDHVDAPAREWMAENVSNVSGVLSTRVVTEAEALQRMETILGDEAQVLSYFDENPFDAFLEVKVDLTHSETIIAALQEIPDVRSIRDNQQVLDQIRNMTRIQQFLGTLFIVAAGAATLVVISHIIRQGVYQNREQINTLRLLGAPESFIALPFLLVGLVMTVGGGLLAIIMTSVAIRMGYAQLSGPIPYIPLPPQGLLTQRTALLIALLSLLLGIGGSLMGLKTSKDS